MQASAPCGRSSRATVGRFTAGVAHPGARRYPGSVNRLLRLVVVAVSLCAAGCSGQDMGSGDDGALGCDPASPPSRTASCVASFTPGKGAGQGQDAFPENIFGEPHGAGDRQGNAADVLSLGTDGEIVLGFGGGTIVDGQGADLIVFENAFYAFGDPDKPFKELAEVSVSIDGTTWIPFPCALDLPPYDGCAGKTPVFANPDTGVSAFDPAVSGGDAFDLAAVGLAEARFVRIRDQSDIDAAPTGGFDLDAISIVHGSP